MKNVLMIVAILLASVPLVGVAQASTPVPTIQPICLSCITDLCTVGTVWVCVDYGYGCVAVYVGYRTVQGTLYYATPGESFTTTPISYGPVHVGSVTVTVDSVVVVNQPYYVQGRVVSDTLCTGPAQNVVSNVLV